MSVGWLWLHREHLYQLIIMDNTPSISFRGLNVRGIQDPTRRLNVLEWLKGNHIDYPCNKAADINLISDTHCHSPNAASKWAKQWSLNAKNSIWSLGTSNRKGVAILINENFRMKYSDMKISQAVSIEFCSAILLLLYLAARPGFSSANWRFGIPVWPTS